MEDAYKLVNSSTVFEGAIIKVVHDTITLPNGKTALREIVRRADGACVLPITQDKKLVLVRQYRHTMGSLVLEVPAGTLEPGETHLSCAKRELEEETGYYSSNLQFLTKICGSIGFCAELIHIYYATDLLPGKQNPDPEEFISVEYYCLEDAIQMIFDGRIADAKTATAILAYRELAKI